MEDTKETQKCSYEELQNIAVQLQHRAATLENQLRNINAASIRLNYLFKVIENKSVFPKEFIDKCSQEIIETMTIDESTNSEESK